jgi:ribosome-associated protein
MAKKQIQAASGLLADIIIHGIQEKKGIDIILMDLRKIHNAMSDYFIVCHGTSKTQVDAIANAVAEEVKKAIGENPIHKEGLENSEWILMDYFDVVVHIFEESRRDFYNLEKLWADAEITKIKEG